MDQLRDLTGTEIPSDRLMLRAFTPDDAPDIFPEATLEQLIAEAMDEWKIPGLAITVVQNGEVPLTRARDP
jgi:CubicO group peptidase (beta-lactamase class C family)